MTKTTKAWQFQYSALAREQLSQCRLRFSFTKEVLLLSNSEENIRQLVTSHQEIQVPRVSDGHYPDLSC